jgi:hypothetical protein
MHDGHKPVTLQKGRKLFVGYALFGQAREQCGRYKDEPDFRGRQAFVYGAHHRHTKAKVLLTEPNLDACRFEQIVQVLGGSLPVIPSVAEEAVPKVWFRSRLSFNSLADRRKGHHLGRRI